MEPFKNAINADVVKEIAGVIPKHVDFRRRAFVKKATAGLETMELKARVTHVADTLAGHFECEYPEAIGAICDHFGAASDDTDQVSSGMRFWPLLTFVERHGLDHFDVSMDAMRRLTGHFSAEFAIRPYIVADRVRALEQVRSWTSDDNPHVRRLCSEGTRPRLPWGIRLYELQEDPELTHDILEALNGDESEYVRRSVANHINDISKDHAKWVTDLCRDWWTDDINRQRMIRHALRGLLKAGDKNALSVLGFTSPKFSDASIKVSPKRAKLNDKVTFTMEATAGKTQNWMIDYAVHYVKANGSTSPKVFKGTTKSVKKGDRVKFEKAHHLKEVSTRKHYAGTHAIEILINGKSVGKVDFKLSL